MQGLKEKFNISPLGFDGDEWQFHSALTVSEINKNYLEELIYEYNNKNFSIEFVAKEIVLLCCIGDASKATEYFSLKIFNMGIH